MLRKFKLVEVNKYETDVRHHKCYSHVHMHIHWQSQWRFLEQAWTEVINQCKWKSYTYICRYLTRWKSGPNITVLTCVCINQERLKFCMHKVIWCYGTLYSGKLLLISPIIKAKSCVITGSRNAYDVLDLKWLTFPTHSSPKKLQSSALTTASLSSLHTTGDVRSSSFFQV